MSKTESFSSFAFISIGANLPSVAGLPLDTIAFALNRLADLSAFPILKSSIYASSPVGSPKGTPDFLNAMAEIIPKKTETPLTLLHKLHDIENKAGRTRSGGKNEARTLDLDLICFNEEVISSPELILPHPRAHERRFVLEPLLEITGNNFLLPGMSESLEELLMAIGEDQLIKKIEPSHSLAIRS